MLDQRENRKVYLAVEPIGLPELFDLFLHVDFQTRRARIILPTLQRPNWYMIDVPTFRSSPHHGKPVGPS